MWVFKIFLYNILDFFGVCFILLMHLWFCEIGSSLSLLYLIGQRSVDLTFPKNKPLYWLVLCIVFLESISWISTMIFVISSCLFGLHLVWSFSKILSSIIEAIVSALSEFLKAYLLRALNFPLGTTFNILQRCCCVVVLFNSRNFISFLISYLTHCPIYE